MDMGTCCDEGCRPSCREGIVCSQMHVAECEAKLFCEITSRLRCEIRHAHCMRELQQLLRLTNNFLAASAVKEKALSNVLCSLGGPEEDSTIME